MLTGSEMYIQVVSATLGYGYLYERLGLLEVGGCSDGEAKEKWNTSPYQLEACLGDQNRFNMSCEALSRMPYSQTVRSRCSKSHLGPQS